MSNRVVTSPALAEPVGFAHAVVAGPGRTVYLGGQTGQDADGRIRGGTLAEQFDRAAGNLVEALAAAGGKPEDLVSMQIFVTDAGTYRSSRPELGHVWRRHLGRHYPALALFEVSGLFDPDALVELMAVAVVPDEGARRHRDGSGWESQAGYSRAVRAGSRILVSGTTAATGDPRADPAAETDRQAREALERALSAVEALGGQAVQVVRSRMLLAPGADWQRAAALHRQLLGPAAPANTTLFVGGLVGDGLLVEIELEAEVAG